MDTLLFLLPCCSIVLWLINRPRAAYLCWGLLIVLFIFWFRYHATATLPISL
ncbi:MAG: DUF5993 family protein [Janthinobacterium lividum]